jgi:hypothetical protein
MKIMRIQPYWVLVLSLILTGLGACKKEKFLTSGGEIRFSTDTLTFDTVFTQTGTFTLGLKIFNPQHQKVNLTSVRLEKGENSLFRINVNGTPGNNVSNIDIAAEDSIYVFATVNIDPNNDTIPFIVSDRLIATMNGKEYSIPFYAYGQNAYYIDGDSVMTQTWHTDKPYVILNYALVPVGETLTIPPRCRIYMNAEARLYVLGTLKCGVGGNKHDSVIFQGDRLDRNYFGNQGYPGEWGGIYFDSSSTGNVIEWTILKNCGNSSGGGLPFGIEVFGKPNGTGYQLTMRNSIVENSIGYGILSFQGTIKAENCLVHDCGAQALAILQGGKYEFDNCDFINYFPKKLSHTDNPTVAVLNYFDISNTEYVAGDLSATFRNCVLYGSIENEVFCNNRDGFDSTTRFVHCLIRNKDLFPSYVQTDTGTIFNTDPMFVDYAKWDFRPKPNSPLIDKGISIPGLGLDLNGIPWTGVFDIGCYQPAP